MPFNAMSTDTETIADETCIATNHSGEAVPGSDDPTARRMGSINA
jgi:hypothetical protein